MATIYVRKTYERDGPFGKEYLIHSTENLYYTSKKPFTSFGNVIIEEGAALEVEAEPTKNPKYLKLKSVKLLDPKPEKPTVQSGKGQAPIPPPLPFPPLAPELQAEWIKKAYNALELAGADKDIEGSLEVELVRQYHAEWMASRIQQEKEKNMNRIIKERRGV